MQIKKGTPYYLLFLALVILTPFLEFLLHNIGTVNERTDLRINFLTIKRLSFFYIFFIIFFFSFVIYTKNKFHKNFFDLIILVSVSYWLFFQYNNIKKFLNDFSLINNSFSSLKEIDGQISLIIIFLLILTLIIFFNKKKSNFINFFFTFFFIINLIFISYKIIKIENPNLVNSKNKIINEKLDIKNSERKNIYLFILDAMPPIELADKILGTDSTDFVDNLKLKGFHYIPNTTSSYGNTFLTIGSIFNLKPLDLIDENNLSELSNLKYPNLTFPAVLREKNLSNLEFNLRKLNYEMKWIGSHFANCHGYNSRYCIEELESKNILFNYEILSFLKKTPIQPIVHNIFKIFNIEIEEKIIFKSNNAIGNFNNYLIKNNKASRPKFVFIHHLISHWPYLVDEKCNYKKHPGKTNLLGIQNAFECNKKLIEKVTDNIIKLDKEAIIIMQSDHSWELSYEDPQRYGDRKRIFNLIKMNKFCEKYNSPNINSVNAIRLALYCATNTKPILINFDEN